MNRRRRARRRALLIVLPLLILAFVIYFRYTPYVREAARMRVVNAASDLSLIHILRVVSNKIDLYLPLACVLDFREVTFMDSSGIAIVISALRKMRELSGRLVLRDVPPQPMKVLRASGMEQIVEIEERSVSV